MELAVETLFRIIIAVFVALVVIFIVSYYYQKSKVEVPIKTDKEGLQVSDVYSEYDMAKVIYGCYYQSNFGKATNRIDCYIVKIRTSLDDTLIRNILFKNFSLGDVYEKVDFSRLVNSVVLVYYENGLVRFRIIT